MNSHPKYYIVVLQKFFSQFFTIMKMYAGWLSYLSLVYMYLAWSYSSPFRNNRFFSHINKLKKNPFKTHRYLKISFST